LTIQDPTQDVDISVTAISGATAIYAQLRDPNNPSNLPTHSNYTWATTPGISELVISHTEYVPWSCLLKGLLVVRSALKSCFYARQWVCDPRGCSVLLVRADVVSFLCCVVVWCGVVWCGV
jgi:hypothetical protein